MQEIYYSKNIQNKIKDHYFVDPDYKTVLIIEGETEEIIIKMLLKALKIENKEIIILKVRGQGNFKWTHSALSVFKNPLKMNIMIILDKDEHIKTIKKECNKLGIMQNQLNIWKKDLEHDNFGIYKVVDKINE